jgi:hypothetical protein
MLSIPVRPFRRSRRPAKERAAARPVGRALVLVSGDYVLGDSGYVLQLGFDRAISMAGYDGSVVAVTDGAIVYLRYLATGPATLVNPTTVQIGLVSQGDWEGEDVHLSAGAGNGIVAVDDGGAWAGVADMVLGT